MSSEPLLSRQQIHEAVAAEQAGPADAVDGGDPEAYDRNELANRWTRLRFRYKEELAEFLGTFVLVLFGSTVDCQVAVTKTGSFLSVNVGWAAGVSLGVWIAGGVSGGALNPAITIALAFFRGFPWKKVPSFVTAQVLGGICGTLAAYGNYWRQIKLIDPELTLATSKLFHAAPGQDLPAGSLFYSEILATAVLVSLIFSFSDRANLAPPHGMAPVAIFILVFGIGAALGVNTSYGMNPARDLGPRIALALVGYKSEIFTHDHLYWIWNGILAPIVGALVGAFAYDFFVYSGIDSPLNKPSHKDGRIRLPNDPER